MPRPDRHIALEALEVSRTLLAMFTERGSIGAIDNVRRTGWQHAEKVISLGEVVDRLAADLARPARVSALRPLVPVHVIASDVDKAERMVTRAIADGVQIDAWVMFRPEKIMSAEEPKVLVCDFGDIDAATRDLLRSRSAHLIRVYL